MAFTRSQQRKSDVETFMRAAAGGTISSSRFSPSAMHASLSNLNEDDTITRVTRVTSLTPSRSLPSLFDPSSYRSGEETPPLFVITYDGNVSFKNHEEFLVHRNEANRENDERNEPYVYQYSILPAGSFRRSRSRLSEEDAMNRYATGSTRMSYLKRSIYLPVQTEPLTHVLRKKFHADNLKPSLTQGFSYSPNEEADSKIDEKMRNIEEIHKRLIEDYDINDLLSTSESTHSSQSSLTMATFITSGGSKSRCYHTKSHRDCEHHHDESELDNDPLDYKKEFILAVKRESTACFEKVEVERKIEPLNEGQKDSILSQLSTLAKERAQQFKLSNKQKVVKTF